MAVWPTIPDASGNGLDGTAVKLPLVSISAASVDGVFSKKAMIFNGVDEAIDFGDVLGKDQFDAYSIEFWIKGTDASTQPFLFAKFGPPPEYAGIAVYFNTGGSLVMQIIHDIGAGDAIIKNTTGVDYLDGTWVHGVITVDGSGTAAGVKMYRNGSAPSTFAGTDALTGSTLNSASLFMAVAEGYGRNFEGELDEVAFYGDVLTPTEVTWLYNAASPPDKLDGSAPTDLDAWWRMGEGITWPAMTDWPAVPDASGNGLFGVEANMEEADLALDSPGGTFSRKSFAFGGGDERITMGNVLDWDGYSPQSWEFWYKTTTTTLGVLLGKIGFGSGFEFVTNSTGTFFIDIREVFVTKDIVLETSGSYNDGAWRHVVVTTTGAAGAASDFLLYINGSPVALNTVRDNLTGSISNTDDFTLGATAARSSPYTGSMTEPAVYSDVLSAGEVTWLYNAGSPPDLLDGAAPTNLEAWWRADGVSWPQQEIAPADMAPVAQTKDGHGQVVAFGGGDIEYFNMRCQDDGVALPGYVFWIVAGAPDDDASEATLVGNPFNITVI